MREIKLAYNLDDAYFSIQLKKMLSYIGLTMVSESVKRYKDRLDLAKKENELHFDTYMNGHHKYT